MFSQASTTIVDGPGWGAAEWLAIATAVALVIGALTGAIVQLVRLRKENTVQHEEGRALVHDVRDRLLDMHNSVNRVDAKVDRLDARLDHHEEEHRRRRRWFD
jgi:hypothetical protein